MRFLKQSTQVTQLIGPFLDKTDGVTEETGLATTGTEISKAGGAFATGPVLGTHDSDGWYPIVLTTTHTNTLGDLVLKCHDAATHLPVWAEFHVLTANVWDSLFGAATDKLDVNVEEWNTTAVPSEHTAGYPIVTVKDGTGTGEIDTTSGGVLVAAIAAGAITAAAIATGAVDADAIAADAVTELQSGLATASALDAVDNFVDTEIATIITHLTDIKGATFSGATDSLEAIRNQGDAAWGGGVTITRSTGALLGTSETVGVSIASGQSTTGSEVDVLGDNTSFGEASFYFCFTTTGTSGTVVISLRNARVSGQPYQDYDRVITIPASWTGKVYLGRWPVTRYMSSVVSNKVRGADITGVAVLYELEKQG